MPRESWQQDGLKNRVLPVGGLSNLPWSSGKEPPQSRSGFEQSLFDRMQSDHRQQERLFAKPHWRELPVSDPSPSQPASMVDRIDRDKPPLRSPSERLSRRESTPPDTPSQAAATPSRSEPSKRHDLSQQSAETKRHETRTPINNPRPRVAATPQESGAADAPEENNTSQDPRLLAPMMLQAMPAALSLLSGQLQNLEPASIPTLVAKNGFIQDALASEDLQGFLQTPQPLANLMTKLGFDEQTQMNFLNRQDSANPMLAPMALLDELGFDSQSVANELTMLASHLPIDGVNPYMLRAAALRQQDPMHPTETQGAISPKANLDQSMVPGKAMGLELQPTETKVTDPSLLTLPPDATEPSDVRLKGASHSFLRAEEIPASLAPDGGIPGSETSQNILSEAAASNESIPIAEAREPSETTSTLGELVSLSSEDPMQKIEADWRQDSIVEWQSPSQDPVSDSVQLTENTLQNTQDLQQLQADNLQEAADNANPDELGNLFSPNKINQANPNKISSEQALSAISKDAISSIADPGSTGQDLRGDTKSSSSQMDWQWQQMRAPGSAPSSSTSEASAPAASSRPQQSASEWVGRLVDKAQMMVKEGGGSIRVDLGDSNFGKVDIALDVKDKNIELKIVAANDQARDALVADLPRLKEALSQQNLDLRVVEVGTRNQQQWSGSSSDGGQHQGHHSFQSEERFSNNGFSRFTESRFQSKSYRPMHASNPSGKIAVRV